MFGPRGARTASGDVIIESREWRDTSARRCPSRQPHRPARPDQHHRPRVVRDVRRRPGSGALNQLLVVWTASTTHRSCDACRRALSTRSSTPRTSCRNASGGAIRCLAPSRATTSVLHAATNVPLSVLDPALTRAGRMAARCSSGIPNKVDRADVLDFYMAKVSHTPDLDSEKRRDELARMTAGYSPAMIEQVCSIALMAAHHDGRAGFDRTDILTAMGTVESGTVVAFEYTPASCARSPSPEAGHATSATAYMGDTHEASSRLRFAPRSERLVVALDGAREGRSLPSLRSEHFKDVLTNGRLAAEHVFTAENPSGGRRRHVPASRTRPRIMVGHSAMPPERYRCPRR